MKYLVILGDGMADWPIEKLNGKTPLEVAKKDGIDEISKVSELGLCKTVPNGMKAGSDVANLSVLGYDPTTCYTGRSPLEAASIGIALKDTDVTARANLVTLSDEEDYDDKTMIDYSAGEISTSEAKELIDFLKEKLDDDKFTLYAGISYRHCLVTDKGEIAGDLTPPHDITGKKIKEHLPTTQVGLTLLEIMKKSYDLLKDHPINKKRISEGKNPANSLWFWGEGTKPNLQKFSSRYGIKGAMISAVDLLKGIAKLTDMTVIEVEGATGNYDTNFTGKKDAALNALKTNDFVYIHMEAPDECGHHGDLENKIFSIEQISEKVVAPIVKELKNLGEDFRILLCPDHPTPIKCKTHVAELVPYLIYDSRKQLKGNVYTEKTASQTGIVIESGVRLMQRLLNA